ncbi:MAG: hypothetical protein FWD67_01490 [Betaproteobacteria bacterium]|nr:hypothetical protein [Betaproteobacteria bacterium]
MFHSPTNLDIKEPSRDDTPPSVTNSLPSSVNYLVRSNFPGLSLEIENPDAEFPLVSFDFEAN